MNKKIISCLTIVTILGQFSQPILAKEDNSTTHSSAISVSNSLKYNYTNIRSIYDEITVISYKFDGELLKNEIKKIVLQNYNVIKNEYPFRNKNKAQVTELIYEKVITFKSKSFVSNNKYQLLNASIPGVTVVDFWWGKSIQLRGKTAINKYILTLKNMKETALLSGATAITATALTGVGAPFAALATGLAALSVAQIQTKINRLEYLEKMYKNINIDVFPWGSPSKDSIYGWN